MVGGKKMEQKESSAEQEWKRRERTSNVGKDKVQLGPPRQQLKLAVKVGNWKVVIKFGLRMFYSIFCFE